MEQTLGKRIAACRKGLGLTQDALAEQLGVTAQAVSKWENDLSCPDIAMLPRLASIFGVTTDALLGVERKALEEVQQAASGKPDAEEPEEPGIQWEFNLDNGRKGYIGLALWVLLTGGMLLASNFYGWQAGFWDILWPSALVVFGLFGLLPRPSFFRIGCLLFGCYLLLSNLHLAPFLLGKDLLLPGILLLFGVCLLMDALRKPVRRGFRILHNGKATGVVRKSYCQAEGESFSCATAFGENRRRIQLPRLSGGRAEVHFGDLTVDLTECREIARDCCVELRCAFGNMEVLLPRGYRAEPIFTTAFGVVDVDGAPDSTVRGTVLLEGSVSFGQIRIKYV